MQTRYDHERLEVYQLARQFNREVNLLREELPRGYAESKDNLRRAAMSITRNIAEGAGKWKIADKVNFYQIARGSASEAAAALDELVDFGAAPAQRVDGMHEMCSRLIAMLIGMIRSLDARRGVDPAR
jgi:four helix bundle protein